MKPIPLLLAIALIVSGCAKPAATPERAAVGAASAAARADARVDAILTMSKAIGEGLPKSSIIEYAGKVKADLRDLAAQLESQRVNEQLMAGTINNQSGDIRVLKARAAELNTWWMGPRFWRAAHWFMLAGVAAVVGWFALGSLSVYAPILWAGKGLAISKLIIRLLPFANLFSNARDHKMAKNLGVVPGYVSTTAGS